MKAKKYILFFILPLIFLWGCSKHASLQKNNPTQGKGALSQKKETQILVGYEKPKKENFKVSLRFYASLVPILQANIFPKNAGWLTHVYVNTGDVVKKGELLAEMDHVQLDRAVAQSQAQLHSAQSLLQSLLASYEAAKANVRRQKAIVLNDKKNMERAENLLKQGFVSQQVYDNARTAYLSDKASLASLEAQMLSAASQVASQKAAMAAARANLQIAQANLSDAFLRAPFSGVVTMRNLDPGAFLSTAVTSNSTPVLTLADLRKLKVMIDVSDVDVPKVHLHESAFITTDAYPGRVYKAWVTRMAQALDPASRTLSVEVDIPNPDESLKPGMYAHVTLISKVYKNAVVIPLNAVVFQGKRKSVWILKQTPQGTFGENVPIEIGEIEGAQVLVLKGLKGNEAIVTQGKEFLKNNTLVKAVQVGNNSNLKQGG
jgi:RND family efflux transporter MFP subunit